MPDNNLPNTLSTTVPIFKISKLGTLGNLLLSGTGGGIIYGIKGTSSSLAASAIDEVLISKGYFSKHYLTNVTFWNYVFLPIFTSVNAILPINYFLTLGLSLTTSLALSYFNNDPLNYHQKIEEVKENLLPVIKFFDHHDVLSNLESLSPSNLISLGPINGSKKIAQNLYYVADNKIIKSLLSVNCISLFETYVTTQTIRILGNNASSSIFSLSVIIANPTGAIWDLTCKSAEIGFCLLLQHATSVGTMFSQEYIKIKVSDAIEKAVIKEILLNENNFSKILHIQNMEEVICSLPNDFHTIYLKGINNFEPLISGKFRELIALGGIIRVAPESIVFTHVVGFLKKGITNFTELQAKALADANTNIGLEQGLFSTDIAKNFSNILLTGVTKLFQDKFTNNITQANNFQVSLYFISLKNVAMTQILELFSQFAAGVYCFYKVLSTKALPLEEVTALYLWNKTVSGLLQGGERDPIIEDLTAKDNVCKVLKALEAEYLSNITHSYNNSNKIIITDYEIKVDGENILKIDYLEFELGKHYAISGQSGIGKTSLLKGVYGCLLTPFDTAGNISLPLINHDKPKLLFVEQNLYTPPVLTLLETIILQSADTLTPQEKQNYKNQIIDLFYELKFSPLNYNNQSTELSSLLDLKFDPKQYSGGQIKILALIKAILSNPDILFLDETLTNMDDTTLGAVQNLLNKYLPDTLIITIDHKAQSNNVNKFYDHWVYVSKEKGAEFLDFNLPFSSQITNEIHNDALHNLDDDIWYDAMGDI